MKKIAILATKKQTQFKAKTNPIQTQTKPIYRKGKNESFCVGKELKGEML
jgi:hypothetical protein